MYKTNYASSYVILTITVMSLCFLSCEKNATADLGIEDEEYRVMSAALKYHRYGRLHLRFIEAPRFIDTEGRVSPPIYPRPRKPQEFLFARDTTRARSLFNVMNSVFGDAKYYLAVSSQTLTNGHMFRVLDNSEDYLEANTPDLLQNLHTRNRESYEISRSRFTDSLIIALVDMSKFTDWLDFYGALPLADGIVRLSRVGFSPDRNQAVVYLFWSAAGLGGGGRFCYLEKSGDVWKVIDISGQGDS